MVTSAHILIPSSLWKLIASLVMPVRKRNSRYSVKSFASPMIIGGGIFKEWWNGSKEQSQRNWHHFKMGQFPHTISYISHTILRVEKKSRTLLTSSLLRLYEKIITFYSSLQILSGITIWCYLIKRHITRWSYYSGIQFLAIVVNFQVFSYR